MAVQIGISQCNLNDIWPLLDLFFPLRHIDIDGNYGNDVK